MIDFKNTSRKYVMTVYKYYDAFIFEPAVLTSYITNSVYIYFFYDKETFDNINKGPPVQLLVRPFGPLLNYILRDSGFALVASYII